MKARQGGDLVRDRSTGRQTLPLDPVRPSDVESVSESKEDMPLNDRDAAAASLDRLVDSLTRGGSDDRPARGRGAAAPELNPSTTSVPEVSPPSLLSRVTRAVSDAFVGGSGSRSQAAPTPPSGSAGAGSTERPSHTDEASQPVELRPHGPPSDPKKPFNSFFSFPTFSWMGGSSSERKKQAASASLPFSAKPPNSAKLAATPQPPPEFSTAKKACVPPSVSSSASLPQIPPQSASALPLAAGSAGAGSARASLHGQRDMGLLVSGSSPQVIQTLPAGGPVGGSPLGTPLQPKQLCLSEPSPTPLRGMGGSVNGGTPAPMGASGAPPVTPDATPPQMGASGAPPVYTPNATPPQSAMAALTPEVSPAAALLMHPTLKHQCHLCPHVPRSYSFHGLCFVPQITLHPQPLSAAVADPSSNGQWDPISWQVLWGDIKTKEAGHSRAPGTEFGSTCAAAAAAEPSRPRRHQKEAARG